jgi:phage host-nuclease inhibitor protein Gam
MAKKTKTAGLNLPVPQSDAEAMRALAEIGTVGRHIALIEADCSEAVRKLTEEAGSQAAPLRERQVALVDGLKTYCEANRERLTGGNKSKTIVFTTGTVSWRNRPASVKLRGKIDVIIERLKAAALHRFIRTKEEIDKDAMLADAEAAKAVVGVTISSDGEDFFVEPLEAEIAGAAS